MEYKTLGELCDVVSGGTPSRSKQDYWNGDIPWIKIGNIKSRYISEADEFITEAGLSESSAKILKKGTILYTIFATLGEVGVLTIDACTNQAIAGITIKDESIIDRDYLFYFLKSKKNYVNEVGRGVAQNNINMSILRGFEVPLRNLHEQQEITEVLDKTSLIIEARRRELEKLDTLIKARFVEMFGDVVLNTKKWENYTWDNVLTIKNGKNQKDVENPKGIYPICGSGGIMNYADDYITESNSVIIGRKGNINNPILMREKFWNVDTAFGLEPNTTVLNVDYLFMFCNFFDFEILNKAVTIPSLTKADLLKIIIPVPPIELQNQFADFVKQVDKSKVVVQKALDEAKILFDSLMQEYFG